MRITEVQLRKLIRQKIQEVFSDEIEQGDVKIGRWASRGEAPPIKSNKPQQEAQPLATFKLGEILKTAVRPTNDKDKEDLSSFISSLNKELERLGAKSGSQALGMLQADKELDANIVKKEGNYYVKNKKYNILIGDGKQVVNFARITGIQVNNLPKETNVSAGLPPRGTEMAALTNKLQGGTYGLGKGVRENKRK